MTITKRNIVLSGDTCNIVPNAKRTVVSFSISGTVIVTMQTSKASIGDEVILMIKGNGSLAFGEGCIFTKCGSIVDGSEESEGNLSVDERWVGRFMFDGTKFIDTYDNC